MWVNLKDFYYSCGGYANALIVDTDQGLHGYITAVNVTSALLTDIYTGMYPCMPACVTSNTDSVLVNMS